MGTTNSTRKFGWKRDTPDSRDKFHKFKSIHYKQLKEKVDLRPLFGPIYDQGALGSCTANAICGAFEYDQLVQKLPQFDPSRLFLYYNERKMEGTVDQDSGASIRDGIKSINVDGICKESLWPYNIEKFKDCPSDVCYTDSKFHRSLKYRRVPATLQDLKTCLSLNTPFIFGFLVYESFMREDWNPSQHPMPIPALGEKILGGHAVVAIGYSDERQCFLIRNSWGPSWGIYGHFMMPYEYITSSNCGDFWTIETVIDEEMKFENIIIDPNDYIKPKKKSKDNSKEDSKPDSKEEEKLTDICLIKDDD